MYYLWTMKNFQKLWAQYHLRGKASLLSASSFKTSWHILMIYAGCSKSNISSFYILIHDVRGGCWLYGSRDWTLPLIFQYILLPFAMWQTLAKWHLTWKHVWSKGLEFNSSMWKQLHSLAFINACWMLMEMKEWTWALWGWRWYISEVVTAAQNTSHIPDGHAQLPHHEIKSISISSSTQIYGLQTGNCVWSRASNSLHWKRWWWHWNITKFVPGWSHEFSHRNKKNIVCNFVRTYWPNTRLKMTVPWIISSPVARCGVTAMSWSPWRGNILHLKICSRCSPLWVKWGGDYMEK